MKTTTTYIRKADGQEVEVLMNPAGWLGFKKVYAETIKSPKGAIQNVYRVPDAQFEMEYALPKPSLFSRFIKGIR